MDQKDIHYKNEIEFLKQKLSSYHKKLSLILGEDYIISNNNNNYEISQFSSASNKKRSYSNATKEPRTNIQKNNSNKKS